MSVRSINASEPCARTVASLDDAITVAKTGESTVLFNLPRSIEDIDDKVTGGEAQHRGLVSRLFSRRSS